MNIETSHGEVCQANPELIRELMRDDNRRGEYVILSESDQVYMQACGDAEPFHVEYREGGGEEHYYSEQRLTKEELQSLLISYLKSEAGWKNKHSWARLSDSQGESNMQWDISWS